MHRRLSCGALLTALVAVVASVPALADNVDTGVIRLAPKEPEVQTETEPSTTASFGDARRGFDYEAFEARLESLWFQRKALLADGRDGDAASQAQLIRSFCDEEGVKRLEALAGALLAEAARDADEGSYAKAIAALELAEAFDPGRAETSLALARIYRESGRGHGKALAALITGLGRSFARQATRLSLFNHLAVIFVVAVVACTAVFSLLAIARHQVAIRHEVEEYLGDRGLGHWSSGAGWGLVLLPFLVWVAAGWAILYWIVLTFRFLGRGERAVALLLLLATALAVPAYDFAVGVYGLSADPVVRTTLGSAGGGYDPDKIVQLRQLVDSHPEDPIYRFLLAGLYKNGRYLEEAYEQYRQVLALDPAIYQAEINIGNILFMTGQHAEAVAAYRRAIDTRPDSVLAYYNTHLAQSESFHFEEAEESLAIARRIDPQRTREIMERSRPADGQVEAVDASVSLGSVWQAALQGRETPHSMEPVVEAGIGGTLLVRLANPASIACGVALLACLLLTVLWRGRAPAGRCIRCGRAFCQACKSGRQGQDYCSQCLHLFVIGDGLAPETKTRKLYEVERYERRTRKTRRLLALVLPGTAQLLRGKAAAGCVLLLLWLTSLLAWQPALIGPFERLAGLSLRLDLMKNAPVPDLFHLDPAALIAMVAAVLVWTAGNVGRLRRREA